MLLLTKNLDFCQKLTFCQSVFDTFATHLKIIPFEHGLFFRLFNQSDDCIIPLKPARHDNMFRF